MSLVWLEAVWSSPITQVDIPSRQLCAQLILPEGRPLTSQNPCLKLSLQTLFWAPGAPGAKQGLFSMRKG
jgi:hypothetical protein